MDALPHTRVVRVSALYRNPPMGSQEQPDYVNAVAELHTGLGPRVLLDHLMTIENREGRVRGDARWQARTLDLDLLLHGDRTECGPRLTLPHPGTHSRPFVIHPLAEIAPEAVIPGQGTAAVLAASVPRGQLERIGESA